MTEKLKIAAMVCLLVGAWGISSTMEMEDEIRQEEHYCEMRRIWEQNRDIEPRYRPGWPNFKPEIECRV